MLWMKNVTSRGYVNFEWLVAHLGHVGVGIYGPKGPCILKTLTGV